MQKKIYVNSHISHNGFDIQRIMYTTSWTDRNSNAGKALIIIILCYYCLFIWDQHGFTWYWFPNGYTTARNYSSIL